MFFNEGKIGYTNKIEVVTFESEPKDYSEGFKGVEITKLKKTRNQKPQFIFEFKDIKGNEYVCFVSDEIMKVISSVV